MLGPVQRTRPPQNCEVQGVKTRVHPMPTHKTGAFRSVPVDNSVWMIFRMLAWSAVTGRLSQCGADGCPSTHEMTRHRWSDVGSDAVSIPAVRQGRNYM